MIDINAQNFTIYLESLKNLSYNSEGQQYLIESKKCAVDFDQYTYDMYKGHAMPSSNDALYFGKLHNYFIEFKGGNPNNIKSGQLRKKNTNSIRTLIDKAGESVSEICSHYIYVLVYKPKEEPEQAIGQTLAQFAGKPPLPFNLDALKGSMFLDVHAISPDDFDNKFIPQHFPPSP